MTGTSKPQTSWGVLFHTTFAIASPLNMAVH